MRPAHRIRRLINAGLGRADLAVVRRSALDVMYGRHAASGHPPPLPPRADELLRSDHPQLREYERRYCDHPAATASQWTEDFVRERVDLRYFRGNNPYVWQHRDRTDPLRYGLTTYYARLEDRLDLFNRLAEDGLFGAYTYDIDGVVVSRDLLDSIAELTFLDEELG